MIVLGTVDSHHQSGLEAIQTSENLGLSLLLNVEAMNARILSGIPRGIEHIHIRKSLLYALTVSPSSSVCTVAHMLTIRRQSCARNLA